MMEEYCTLSWTCHYQGVVAASCYGKVVSVDGKMQEVNNNTGRNLVRGGKMFETGVEVHLKAGKCSNFPA